MKSFDEIKKGLLHCSEDGCKGCNYAEDCDMADSFSVLAYDALQYIRDLEAAHRTESCENADYDCIVLGKARKRIAELEAQVAKDINVPRWVSVEDRLPDNGALCVVHGYNKRENECYDIAFRYRTGWEFGALSSFRIEHWMYIPEPPKEG